ENAELMAEQLRKEKIKPEHFLSSPAVRAFETAKLFAKILEYPIENIEINTSIYSSSVGELHTLLLCLDNKLSSAILFGHDPTLTNFTGFLTKQVYEKIPTSGIVAIDFSVNHWNMIQ